MSSRGDWDEPFSATCGTMGEDEVAFVTCLSDVR